MQNITSWRNWLFLPLLLAIIFNNHVKAQNNYMPMDSVTDWYVRVSNFGTSSYLWYSYVGDTTFNNKSYRVIEYPIVPGFYDYIYLRENAATKRVYRYLPQNNLEYLYYNFDLVVGGKLDVYRSGQYYSFTVFLIDSVPSPIGPLRRWWFNGPIGPGFRYIETIGGNPLQYENPIFQSDPVYQTVCAYNRCQQLFGNSDCFHPPQFASTTNVDTTLCAGTMFLGHDTSGFYTDTLTNPNGCDSIIFSAITVLPVNNTSVDTTICEGETFLGHGTSGAYADTLTNLFGCDSIILSNITVEALPILVLFDTICPGEEVYGISDSGYFELIIPATIGCDTALALTLSLWPADHLDCISSTINLNSPEVHLSPNPVTGLLSIDTGEYVFELSVYDLYGQSYWAHKSLSPGINTIDLSSLRSGMYLICLRNEKGMLVYRVLKF